MKALKIALLGTAALAVVSVSARADALADLKSAILGVDGSYVAATADAPASDTMVTWSGNVKFGVVVQSNHGMGSNGTTGTHFNSTDFVTKAGLSVTGKTETAVGEVGVTAGFATGNIWAGSAPTNWGVDGFKGWWKLTPAMTLTAGWDVVPGGLGGFGTDALSNNFITATTFVHGVKLPHAGGVGAAPGVALGYSDGPVSLSVGVSDAGSTYRFGASVGYSADSYKITAAGWSDAVGYQVGVGVGATMDMISLTAAAAVGHDTTSVHGLPATPTDYWIAEASAKATLGDSLSAELGVGYRNLTTIDQQTLGFGGGVYYSPVSQLTIGLEAGMSTDTVMGVADAVSHTTAALVTVFKF